MTYAQFGTIRAIDFNQLCGGNTVAANTLNTTWSTGTGSAGYGQTAIANVNVGDTITASGKWTTLVNNTSNAAIHQGTTINSVTPPAAGTAPSSVITYNSAIATNLQTIYSTRLNASIQGTTTANTATYGAAWQNALTFTFTATFANGDAARYFFNSGGQLKISCSHPAGTGINATFNGLAANVGNVYLSSPTSGTATIAGNAFSGITKAGTGGNAPSPYLTNNGYYALTTTNTTVFTQTAVSGSSSISYVMKSNGTQGSNADTGSIITIYAVWDEIPDGLLVSSGSATTLTAIYPESTYISNTWGAVTLSGSVTGS
jgi:hypothetical protein